MLDYFEMIITKLPQIPYRIYWMIKQNNPILFPGIRTSAPCKQRFVEYVKYM